MLAEFAPAKLNLYLHVTGRRADGYHMLDSLVVFLNAGDEIGYAPGEAFQFKIEGSKATALLGEDPERNLALRAIRALAEKTGNQPEGCWTLVKNLPIASGIGGGSADAAAALRLAAKLWNIRDEELLFTVARTLGQDIPACILSKPCWFRGIGDEIAPAGVLPRLFVLLANPGIAVSTADVFKTRAGEFSAPAPFPLPQDAAGLVAALQTRRNDLTEAAQKIAPEINEVLTALGATRNCLLARMAGSGATCFGLYPSLEAAQKAALELKARANHWWLSTCETLP